MQKNARPLSKSGRTKDRPHRLVAYCGLLVLILSGFAACSKPAGHFAGSEVDYWTCAMHPSVHSKIAGKCPICGMDLTPVRQTTVTNDSEGQRTTTNNQSSAGKELSSEAGIRRSNQNEFIVPVRRQQQIGVTYAEARRRHMRFDIRSVGTLEPDQAQVFECVTGVDGYVEELRVSSPGEHVTVGQPLMLIYTPDLRTPEQELVNLLKVHENGSVPAASIDPVIEAARRRLQLLNVSPVEISELERTLQPTDHFLLRSRSDGIVSEVPVKPGMRVKQGDKVMTILNSSRLWLWANFYENEIGFLQEGQSVRVGLLALPNRSFDAKIGAISPVVDPAKRTVRVRIDIPNPDGRLRPGMYADVVAEIDAGEILAIPFDAVLPTGSQMLVFVDKGSGTLESRFIQVGRQFVDSTNPSQERYYQVISGLQEGDRVVSSANFLIDAEAQVQGIIKDFRNDRDTD
jgi:membrane fusion protein, copper/silver efflux system